jgi:Na+/proline symporter
MDSYLSVISLFIYFLLLAAIVWHTRYIQKEKGQEGYIIGGRKVGLIGTTFSQLISLTDGSGLVIGIMLAVSFGFGFWWGVFGAMIGYALLSLQAIRIRQMAGDRHYVTVSDFLKDRCGNTTERLSAILIGIMAFFALAGQIHISGVIFGKLMNIEEFWGILLVAIVVGGYLWIGGYMTIIRTDILQGVIIISLAFLALAFGDYPALPEMKEQFTGIDKAAAWGMFLFHIPVIYAYFDTWQRLFSAGNPAIARKATLIGMVMHAVLWGGIIMFGITISQYGSGTSPDELAYSVFTSDVIWPVIGAGLGVCLLALIMSSIDSRAYTVASTLASNVLRIDHDNDREKFMKILRRSIVVMFVLTVFIAIFIRDIVQFMINSASTVALLAPVLFAAVHYEPVNRKIYVYLVSGVLVTGCIVWGAMFSGGLFQGFLMNVVPVAIVAVLSVAAIIVERYLMTAKTFAEKSN